MGYSYSYGEVSYWTVGVSLIMAVVAIAALWKIFEKADEEGWKSIIPFYNVYILFKIVYGSGIRMFLLFIPFVNIYIGIKLYWDLGEVFGKEAGFKLGLIFLSFIFLPILGFGDAEYEGYLE